MSGMNSRDRQGGGGVGRGHPFPEPRKLLLSVVRSLFTKAVCSKSYGVLGSSLIDSASNNLQGTRASIMANQTPLYTIHFDLNRIDEMMEIQVWGWQSIASAPS